MQKKVFNFGHVIVGTKSFISIQAAVLQYRLFMILLGDVEANYKDLTLHTEARWLSKGKVLVRFPDPMEEMKLFLKSVNDHRAQNNDKF